MYLLGVLWIDHDWLIKEGFKPDLKCIDKKKFPEKLAELANSIMSCKIPEESEDDDEQNMLRDFVLEVQQHRHTGTCKKKKTICRFDFPKLVSEKTLLAIPLDEKYPGLSEETKKEKLEKFKNILSKAKEVLSDEKLDSNMTFEQFYQKIECSKKEYEEAISTTVQGNVIILERKVKEVWTNTYNPNWLKCWNGNMDIQLAHDPYAVLTYITTYVGKDETGMTKLLKDVLRETKHLAREEQLKELKKTWLTHRQIGASEAVYRLIQGLHLTESNIACVFVATGFPENRSLFFKKVSDEDPNSKHSKDDEMDVDAVLEEFADYYSDHEDELDDNNEEEEETHLDNIKLADRPGTYKQAVTVHERYAVRPKRLKHMCLAQFATLYTKTSRVKKDTVFDDDRCSESTSEHIIFKDKGILNARCLPRYLDLRKHKLGYMRIRNHPAILRMHSSKKKEGVEECYAELLLYFPWKDEDKDLKREECNTTYIANKSEIETNKKGIFPNDDVVEMLENLENCDFNAARPTHIYDMLDSQMIQEDEDDQAEGITDDPEFAARDPDVFKVPENPHDVIAQKYKVLTLPDDPNDLLEMTRKLVPEQLQALSKIIGYCKDVKRNFKDINHEVKPLRLIIHGGSGCGKSTVLKCASLHAEKLLRKAGGSINKPRVLICAHTGMAAKLVNGTTLSKTFGLPFTNLHVGLDNKKLAEAREWLSELQLIIIDELSLISADQLYKLHMRLCEIFQSEDKFANIGMVLVGDILQLKPIRGRYIFQEPKNDHFAPFYEVDSLWHSFEVIDLKENHRQGEALHFSRVLNKMRFGIVDEEVVSLLKTRLLDKPKSKLSRRKRKKPENKVAKEEDLVVTHVNYTNDEVNSHNNNMLNFLTSDLVEINLIKPPKFKPYVTDWGTIGDTNFMAILTIKIGSRVMLIFNIDTIDGLVNGELGHVIGIEKKDDYVQFIIVKFDDKNCGARHRKKFPGLSAKYAAQNGTPIGRHEFDYVYGKKEFKHAVKKKIKQFPLRLSWAITCHKMQGQTIKTGSKLVVHWHTKLQDGMAYVM